MYVEARCIKCNHLFGYDENQVLSIGISCDCPNCDAALMVYPNQVVRDFHEVLHESDPRWPKDGKGTNVVDLKGR